MFEGQLRYNETLLTNNGEEALNPAWDPSMSVTGIIGTFEFDHTQFYYYSFYPALVFINGTLLGFGGQSAVIDYKTDVNDAFVNYFALAQFATMSAATETTIYKKGQLLTASRQ